MVPKCLFYQKVNWFHIVAISFLPFRVPHAALKDSMTGVVWIHSSSTVFGHWHQVHTHNTPSASFPCTQSACNECIQNVRIPCVLFLPHVWNWDLKCICVCIRRTPLIHSLMCASFMYLCICPNGRHLSCFIIVVTSGLCVCETFSPHYFIDEGSEIAMLYGVLFLSYLRKGRAHPLDAWWVGYSLSSAVHPIEIDHIHRIYQYIASWCSAWSWSFIVGLLSVLGAFHIVWWNSVTHHCVMGLVVVVMRSLETDVIRRSFPT